MKYHRLNQIGETIIEVMMSAAILGAVISASFVIVRRSLNDGQAASERTQALKIAESQLERVKYLATQEGSGIFDQGGDPFCIAVDDVTGNMTIVPYNGADEAYKQCDHGNFPESDMTVRIDYIPQGLDNDETLIYDNNYFKVTIEWDKVGGGGREKLEISYRLHPPADVPAAVAPTTPTPPVPTLCPSGKPLPPSGLVAECTKTCSDGSVIDYDLTCPPPPPPPTPVECGGEPLVELFKAAFGFEYSTVNGGQPNTDPLLARDWGYYLHRGIPDFSVETVVDSNGKNIVLNSSDCNYAIDWVQYCSAVLGSRAATGCGRNDIGYDQLAEAARIEMYSGFSSKSVTPGDQLTRCDTSTLIAWFDTDDTVGSGSIDGDGEVRELSAYGLPGQYGAPPWTGRGDVQFASAHQNDKSNPIRCIRLTALCYADQTDPMCLREGNPLDWARQPNPIIIWWNPFDVSYWHPWWGRLKVAHNVQASVWVDSLKFNGIEK